MDINKWLAETAEAVEPARKPDHPGSLAIARHPKKAPVLDLPFSKRRAKRRKVVSKDSSILAPEDIPTEAPARYIAPHAHQYSDCSVLSEDAGHTSMREDGPHNAANPYQRRKRHKTKADRYDPKPRSPSMRQEDGGKQKRKSTERDKEARRPKKGKAAPSVIRNFHAANVPRERLTMQSRANIGIFKKGKASAPFRGRGLPDLAFSEMKFLQNRAFPAEDAVGPDEPNKRRKDGKRLTEEEISSYFATKRSPLAERSQNDPKCQLAASRNEIRHTNDSQRQSSSLPSISLPKGNTALPKPVDEKDEQRSASNTYFTWSDSVRHSSRPKRVRPAPTRDIETNKAMSASVPSKARASSYDIRHPDPLENRHPIRRQTTLNSKVRNENRNTSLDHAASTATPSCMPSNRPQELDSERTKSKSLRLNPTTRQSAHSAGTRSLAHALTSPGDGAQQHNLTLSCNTRFPRGAASTPVSESQDATSTSITRLLDDCDSAYLRSTRIRTPWMQSAVLDPRTRSRSTNDMSTTRYNGRFLDDFEKSVMSKAEEEVLDVEQAGYFVVEHVQDPQTLEYRERIPPRENFMPTRWLQHEMHSEHGVDYGLMGMVLMNDSDDGVPEQLGIAEDDEADEDEEDEDEEGLVGFWQPNMLY